MSYRWVRNRPLIYIFGGFSQSSSLLSHGPVWAPFPVPNGSCAKLSALFEALNPHAAVLEDEIIYFLNQDIAITGQD